MLNINSENIDNTKEVLRLGKTTEFWALLTQALDESIAHLQDKQDSDDLKELLAEQYKLEAELLKAKRAYLKHLKELPDTLIAYLTEPAGNLDKEENFDPYFTARELGELEKGK